MNVNLPCDNKFFSSLFALCKLNCSNVLLANSFQLNSTVRHYKIECTWCFREDEECIRFNVGERNKRMKGWESVSRAGKFPFIAKQISLSFSLLKCRCFIMWDGRFMCNEAKIILQTVVWIEIGAKANPRHNREGKFENWWQIIPTHRMTNLFTI